MRAVTLAANLILIFLLVAAAVIVGGSMGFVIHQRVGAIVISLLIVAAGIVLAFREESRSWGVLVLLLCGIAYFASLYVIATSFSLRLMIYLPETEVATTAKLPLQVRMKTKFFTSMIGCPVKAASDTGSFAHPSAASGDMPDGASYDPLLFRPMLQVTDSDGLVLENQHQADDTVCRDPYVLYPGVTIEETINLKDLFDLNHPGTYRIEAVYGFVHSNPIILTVTP